MDWNKQNLLISIEKVLNGLNKNEILSFISILIGILIFKYIYSKIYSNLQYYKDLSSKKSLSFINSDLPPVFPNGWIPVACSSSIKNDKKIYKSILCGNEIILFRDENENLTCLDAYCSHLGANLAYGNSLVFNGQNCVQCPFHGWLFNKSGDCVSIPYNCSKEIPRGTSIKSYSIKEINGYVYVWFHADGEEPSWSLENIDEISSKKWKLMGKTEHIVSCHLQEIPENGADAAHLNVIHQGSVINGSNFSNSKWLNNLINKLNYHEWYAEYDLDNECQNNSTDTVSSDDQSQSKNKESHACKIFLKKRTIFCTFNVFEMNLNIKQIGPAIVHLKFKAHLFGLHVADAVFVQSIQPLEPFKHRLIHQLFSEDGFFKRILSKLFLLGEAKMVERDIYIWNKKKFLKRPFLLKNEKSIAKYRKWFLQFYSASSPTFKQLRDGLEW